MEAESEVAIDLEEPNTTISTEQFITEVYELVQKHAKRNEGKVLRSDFYYEMIPRLQGDVWWMAVDHPVALMLVQNEFKPVGEFSGMLGMVVIYEGPVVKRCIDAIIDYCQEFKLSVE